MAAVPIFCLDGNIACLKTSCMTSIRQKLGSECVEAHFEPVGLWSRKRFLSMVKSGGNFVSGQLGIMTSLFDQYFEILNSPGRPKIHLMERSPTSALKIFSAAAFDAGVINEDSLNALEYFYETFNSKFKNQLDIQYIYIRSNPQNCAERVRRRGLQYDVDNADFLTTLSNKYDEYYSMNPPLFTFDCEFQSVGMGNVIADYIKKHYPQYLKHNIW